ncbi:TPA: bifunctional 4-hydroxy-2-oxoglutarate aldolase/2-dehydro-3-deoxy-phosphogluconate aldolase [Providencia stuartii]|uniref:bifunctional 4-hydroxy-2-oxoglutarate aldolase/2-dehydro-3-deoxy-phosphogluconate aldolase n=1 Tax=Providencia stuartii TaxID=588 RepID=UPI00123B598A|nr:bifunctional 4-hydroxy-2-oxoglutarate aldolase/2-dehydro-3-deoxy-phosphogluconate aldolase [Providencia stuartii]QET95983.1 bifunctional 4-hydroxy-2-oxoglutarate aldolase/2-dehydro-3-deoxy-phosphogluconate aldolase [Providencia stuartii]HEM8142951.1 bifunctional 4-hydroxy-2-oxoglutarate aldolase/2-dehydro-3-deoxy-phosphogluconate aldolase [Providencia stuartii]HEM8872947.1 bifunctional 4-hydroxy-2-oxoglutarate aldolase/2-dehydro-3-deoxy-phosphogluconate aldolase [Providencia stuartii]
MNQLIEKLKKISVVPVITINKAEHGAPLAQALMENGLPCAEVTFRTPAAVQAIKNMRAAHPEILIGAGTVLTTQQVDQAIDAGVDFIVSPGFNPKIVTYCQQKNVIIIPGLNNPSLVEQALEFNLTTVKFFPAEASGGVAMLKAMSAVYPVNFMPTGGINPKNIKEYKALPSVLVCGGSWMVPNELIDNENWQALGQLIADAASL